MIPCCTGNVTERKISHSFEYSMNSDVCGKRKYFTQPSDSMSQKYK